MEFKLRLIILRTCTCEVISHLYRNKLDVVERGGGVQAAKAPVGGLGGEAPPPGPGAEPLLSGFSAARHGTIKCNFTAAPQAGKERFLCLFQIKSFKYFQLNEIFIYSFNVSIVKRTPQNTNRLWSSPDAKV